MDTEPPDPAALAAIAARTMQLWTEAQERAAKAEARCDDLRRRLAEAEALLGRLRDWSRMYADGEGRRWRGEIDAVLGDLPALLRRP